MALTSINYQVSVRCANFVLALGKCHLRGLAPAHVYWYTDVDGDATYHAATVKKTSNFTMDSWRVPLPRTSTGGPALVQPLELTPLPSSENPPARILLSFGVCLCIFHRRPTERWSLEQQVQTMILPSGERYSDPYNTRHCIRAPTRLELRGRQALLAGDTEWYRKVKPSINGSTYGDQQSHIVWSAVTTSNILDP